MLTGKGSTSPRKERLLTGYSNQWGFGIFSLVEVINIFYVKERGYDEYLGCHMNRRRQIMLVILKFLFFLPLTEI